MDNELAEGIELGSTLIITVAILLLMAVLCGFSRTAYINRANTINYQNNLLAGNDWREIYTEVTDKDIQGHNNTSTRLTIDNLCQWMINHEKDYRIVVIDTHAMFSTMNLDTSRLNYDKWKTYWYPSSSGFNASNCGVYTNKSATEIVDYIYGINIARGIHGWTEAKNAYITVYDTEDFFYHNLEPSSIFNYAYIGKSTFDDFYSIPKNAVIVFSIR